MHHPVIDRIRTGRSLGLFALAGALTCSAAALGQDVRVMRDGDGREMTVVSGGPGGASFMIGAVSFEELLRPQIQSRNARTIAESLGLDAGQRALLEVLLDDYRLSFDSAAQALRNAHASTMPPMPELGGILGGGAGEAITLNIDDLVGDSLGDVSTIDVEEDGEGEGRAISVRIGVGGPGGPGGGSGDVETSADNDSERDSDVGVSVDVTNEDGESIIDPEVLKALEEKIRSRLEQRLAEREVQDALAQAADDADDVDVELGPPATPDELRDLAIQFRQTREELQRRFFEDLDTFLTEQQAEHLDDCRNAVRRANDLMRGQLSGESVDVASIVKRTGVGSQQDARLVEAISNYEQQLTDALKRRAATLVDAEIASIDLLEEDDPDERLRLADLRAAARIAVRDVNQRAVHAVRSLLDEEQSATFMESVKSAAFPQLSRSTLAHHTIEAALGLDDLDDDTVEAIENIAAQFAAEIQGIDDQLIPAILNDEPGQERRMMEFMQRMREASADGGEMRFEPPDMGASQQMQMDRMRLVRRTSESIRNLLTDEQKEKLPKAEPMFRFGGPGQGMPMGRIRTRSISTQDDN